MHCRHIFSNRPSVFENFQILWFSWQSLKSYDKFMAFFKFPILYDKFRNLLDVGALILKKVIWGNKKYSEYRGEKKVLIKLPGVYRFNKNTQLRNLFLQSKLSTLNITDWKNGIIREWTTLIIHSKNTSKHTLVDFTKIAGSYKT